MSIPAAKAQGTFFDVSFLVNGLFTAKDHYGLFREKILPALHEVRESLCALYCEDNGRPAIEPVVAAGVTLLQFMEKVPDRKAAEMIRMHLGWKYALDLELDYKGFHPTSLVKFRNRLVAAEAQRVVFDALLEALRSAGLVRRGGKQRLDSTHVLGAVAKMSRLEVVRETIRLFLEFVKRHGGKGTLRDWERLEVLYLDSQVAWHRMSKEGLKEKYRQAGRDALDLIRWVRRQPSFMRDSDLQQRRREMQTEEFKDRMHQRNGIEGTVSEFARAGGRRTRYRGLAKTTLANYFQGAAVNANRWIRLTQWQVEKSERKMAA